MSEIPTSHPSSSSSSTSPSPPEDRFTTHWTSHNDPAAVAWATIHGIDFSSFWFRYINVGHGHARLVPRQVQIPGSTNMKVLRQQNIISDQEVRDKHANDAELVSGMELCGVDGDWKDATRGEKLRTCAAYKELYDAQEQKKTELGVDVVKRLREKIDGKIAEAKEDLKTMKGCYMQNVQLEAMVEGETKVGWEWKVGLEEQVGLREGLLEMEGWFGKWSTNALKEGKKELGL